MSKTQTKIELIFITLFLFFTAPLFASTAVSKHPPHTLTVWTTKYKKTIFRVIKLPHCEHIEVIASNSTPETKEQAQKRLGGIVASTACFYNFETLQPVDLFRRYGKTYVGSEAGRSFLAIYPDGQLQITRDFSLLQAYPEITAIALGQRLTPFAYDGFSDYFVGVLRDRMVLGLSSNRIYLVQARTDLRKMASFIRERLKVEQAINLDGGHSVRGKSPFHLVFRWRKQIPNKPE